MQTKTIELGSSTFHLTPIPPFVALAMFGDLQKLVAPVLAELVSAAKPGETSVEQDELGSMILKASQAMDGATLTKWADRLLVGDWVSVSINNAPPVRLGEGQKQLAFSSPGDVLQLMVEVLIFNFEGPIRSFVSRFGDRIGLGPKA